MKLRRLESISPAGRLRISMVEPSGGLYGSEFALLDVLTGLEPERFSSEVLLPRRAPFCRRLEGAGIVYREVLPANVRGSSRLRKLQAYARVLLHWRRQRPDLVYINQGGILRPMAATAACLGIPILCQVQTLEDARWVSRLTHCHRQVSTFVCNSEYIATQCHVPRERLSVVYQGCKLKGLHNGCPAHSDGLPLRVGLIGRICEEKGHHLAVEAARELSRRGDSSFCFCFIGEPGSDGERLWLKAVLQEPRLAALIQDWGYQKDLRTVFAGLHLLAMPTVVPEAFGRTFFEAAEAEVPVLAADSGGLRELSRRFGVGVRFDAGDVNDFLRRLNWMAENYATVKEEFVSAGRQMLNALNLASYWTLMRDLIRASATGRPVSVQWLGIPVKQGAGLPSAVSPSMKDPQPA